MFSHIYIQLLLTYIIFMQVKKCYLHLIVLHLHVISCLRIFFYWLISPWKNATSLVIRKLQSCASCDTASYPWGWQESEKGKITGLVKIWRSWNPDTVPIGMLNGAAPVHNIWCFLNKLNRTTVWVTNPMPKVYIPKSWKQVFKKKPVHEFMVALSQLSKVAYLRNNPNIHDQMNG